MSSSAADDEIIFNLLSLMHVYRSGRVERFEPAEFVPASLDLATCVESKDVTVNPSTGLTARLYLPSSVGRKLPLLLFFHGGGFCVHRAASANYHAYLNHVAERSRVLILSIDYRLAPEHPIPIPYDDCWEALLWASDSSNAEPWISEWGDRSRVFLAGDSAGGSIAHDLGMRLGAKGEKVEGLVLLNPYFWGKEKLPAELRHLEEGTAFSKVSESVWPFLCPGSAAGNDDPRVNPWANGAGSLAGLGCRRVLVAIGDADLISHRARVYCEKLRESGWEGEVEFLLLEGADHGFFLSYPGNNKAEAFMDRFVQFCGN